MDKLVNLITDYCCQNNIIDKSIKEVYDYGFRLIFADIINFSIILISGVILSKFLESVVFLIVFCTLRRYTGGFHAKSFSMCRIFFLTTYLCILLLSYLFKNISLGLVCIISILNISFIARYSPIEHHNKPLSVSQIKSNKVKSITSAIILSIASLIFRLSYIQLGVIILFTVSAVAFLMLVSILYKRKEDS